MLEKDVRGNWEFCRAQWSNYEVATQLIEKDVPIRIATYLKMMDKYCCQIYKKKYILLSEKDNNDIDKILEDLDRHLCQNQPHIWTLHF